MLPVYTVIISEESKIYPKYWVGCVSQGLIREATSRKLHLLWRLTRQVQNLKGRPPGRAGWYSQALPTSGNFSSSWKSELHS